MGELLIYGAYGYTGRLIAEQAVARGLRPVLAGRDPVRLGALARALDCPAVAMSLTDGESLRAALASADAVLHCAGPFADTVVPMLAACLETRTHYLDITGETDVLLACAALGRQAEPLGVMVMPGTGFDVVPTDAMAALLARRLPDANSLRLAFRGIGTASRGTMRTGVRQLARPTMARKNGVLRMLDRPDLARVDFGNGPQRVRPINWGDLVTAWTTTGVPDIEVYFAPSDEAARLLDLPWWMRRLLSSRMGRGLIERRLARGPEGPDARMRAEGTAEVWGEMRNAEGGRVALRMTTAEPYRLTALSAVEIAIRVLDGQIGSGFRTPAGFFGPELALGLDGTVLHED
ncbi:MAG: saccharopine dehydrogenase NADP-binding domain-containing protein [Rhodobacteraceae bacterium]|nr:saccharopine dehydrogenase NADP-binding domain-containing protein [Paracoccaceae bacterium]